MFVQVTFPFLVDHLWLWFLSQVSALSLSGNDGLPEGASPDSSGTLSETAAASVQIDSTDEQGCSLGGTVVVYFYVELEDLETGS